MAVVIDEMQVDMAEPQPPQRQRGGPADGGGEMQQPTPDEVERMWRQQQERHERVRAY